MHNILYSHYNNSLYPTLIEVDPIRYRLYIYNYTDMTHSTLLGIIKNVIYQKIFRQAQKSIWSQKLSNFLLDSKTFLNAPSMF